MISPYEIILRLLLGALYGGAIGYERQIHGRPAGLRTHLIVCLASVLLMITAESYYRISLSDPAHIRIDPTRIAAGAITGVGFIGAGVILRMGVTIQGLTTAASIWMVSAIGLSLGSGVYLATTIALAFTLFALLVLRKFERNISTVTSRFVTVAASEDVTEEAITAVLKKHSSIGNIDYEKDVTAGEVIYHLAVSITKKPSFKIVLDELSSLKGVKKVFIKS